MKLTDKDRAAIRKAFENVGWLFNGDGSSPEFSLEGQAVYIAGMERMRQMAVDYLTAAVIPPSAFDLRREWVTGLSHLGEQE